MIFINHTENPNAQYFTAHLAWRDWGVLADIVRVDRVKHVVSNVFLVNDILLVDDKHHLLDVTNQYAVHDYVGHVYHVNII